MADGIELLANTLKDAEEMLQLVETAALSVGLGSNAMIFNIHSTSINTLDDSNLEIVDDFKYLGAWIGSGEKRL